MSLDFTTMLCLQVVASLTSATILATSRGLTAPPGIRDAMYAMVSLACGYILLLVRDAVPRIC